MMPAALSLVTTTFTEGHVIRTPEQLADAPTDQFLANADVSNNTTNDEIVQQLRKWRRRNR